MGYYITIKNELLEPKHVEAMGASVWLFMFFLDKVMAINENGIGKVLNGRPITYSEHVLPALGISERTYQRWVATLKQAGYIRALRTPYGLVVYVNKAEKMWGQKAKSRNTELPFESSAKSGVTKKLKRTPKKGQQVSPAKSGGTVTPKTAGGSATFGRSNNDNSIDSSNNNKHAAKAAVVPKSEIGKLYYQVIKQYELPITNHNVIHSKIRQWEKEEEPQKAINYLKFLLNQYQGIKLKYKPQINSALDIYSKRTQIKNALTLEISNQQQRNIREV